MTQLEDANIAAPLPMDGFLFVARQMLDGANTIHRMTKEQQMAVTYLCGHAAETTLKAALSKCGVSLDELKSNDLGHNLGRLWGRAVAERIPLPPEPEWLVQLDRVHRYPYNVRYPLDFHAIVLPNQSAMLAGCAELLKQVGFFCK